ncbi:hypothetical protein ACN20G_25790 [Streptomyces sp. BI20]|uniref:hypothetical protein n=1 Tax=Streptomyces sp. BI20 TaxID=3403460 RepID=UPI003C762E2E
MTSKPAPASPLARVCGVLAFVLIVGGASGLAHEWFSWIRLFGFLRFLVPEGSEVFGYLVMIVSGIAIGAAGAAAGRRARS